MKEYSLIKPNGVISLLSEEDIKRLFEDRLTVTAVMFVNTMYTRMMEMIDEVTKDESWAEEFRERKKDERARVDQAAINTMDLIKDYLSEEEINEIRKQGEEAGDIKLVEYLLQNSGEKESNG